MTLVDELKKEIEQIKLLIFDSDNLTTADLEVLKRTLKVIQDCIEIAIYEQVLSERKEEVIEIIDNKIKYWSKEEVKREDALNEMPFYAESTSSKRIKKLISEIELVKKNIMNEKTENISSIIVDRKKSVQELVDLCSIPLAIGYNDFIKYFGDYPVKSNASSNFHDFIINKEIIDNMFKLINNKPVMEELRQIVDINKQIDIKKEEIKKVEHILDKCKVISENSDKVKQFITSMKIQQGIKDSMARLSEYISLLEDNIRDYELSNIFIKAISRSRYEECKKHLDQGIAEKTNLNEREQQNNENIRTIERELLLVGLGDIVIRVREDINNDSFIELSLKNGLSLNKNVEKALAFAIFKGVDITPYQDKYATFLEERKEELGSLEQEKSDIESKISDETKFYLSSDYETCKRIIALDRAELRYSKTPIVCAFILKTISDVKSLPWQDVVDMVSSQEHANELLEKYSEIVGKYMDKKMLRVASEEADFGSFEDNQRKKRI